MLMECVVLCVVLALSLIIGLHVAPLMTWVERRQCALIQRRVGPNRVGIFGFRLLGLGQPIADAVKLLYKEDYIPSYVNKFFYVLAPIIPSALGLCAVTVLPLGHPIEWDGVFYPLQVTHLNVGFLLLFALSSLSVYGTALAGWSSNNKYALLGGLRASAQMVSYELAMGLSLVPLVLIYGTLDLQDIINFQGHSLFLGFLPNWGVFYAPVSFFVFLITIFAETNRLPFDLAEGEAELVAGFLVEYGAMRWSLFFLGEYAMMFALSGLTVCLFLGGYEIPYFPYETLLESLKTFLGSGLASLVAAAIGLGVLIVKILFFMFLFVQVRFTLPRFRYDQLMRVGWVYLLPVAFANLFVSGLVAGFLKFK